MLCLHAQKLFCIRDGNVREGCSAQHTGDFFNTFLGGELLDASNRPVILVFFIDKIVTSPFGGDLWEVRNGKYLHLAA